MVASSARQHLELLFPVQASKPQDGGGPKIIRLYWAVAPNMALRETADEGQSENPSIATFPSWRMRSFSKAADGKSREPLDLPDPENRGRTICCLRHLQYIIIMDQGVGETSQNGGGALQKQPFHPHILPGGKTWSAARMQSILGHSEARSETIPAESRLRSKRCQCRAVDIGHLLT